MRTSVSCVWGLDVCAILRVSPDLLRWRFMTVHIDGQSVVVLVAEHITAVERVCWFERLQFSPRDVCRLVAGDADCVQF